MKATSLRHLPIALALFVLPTLTPQAQKSTGWSEYLGGPDSSHYSPLKQVNSRNVKQLEVAWNYETGDELSYTFCPLVVDNIAFVAAKQGALVALDATTGKELWVYTFPGGGRFSGIAGQRGANYWESKDRTDRRILVTSSGMLHAIDARTGKLVDSFADHGKLDLKTGIDRASAPLGSRTPGRIFENLIILGSATGEGYLAPPGDIRALQWMHALTLAAILLFAAPLARFIPLSSLAAILLVVAYNMGEWREIPELLRLSKLEIFVWITTFLLTVFVDLTAAVEAGMVLSVLVFIRKVTSTTIVAEVTREYLQEGRSHTLQNRQIPSYVCVFRIDGPFLFGGTDKLEHIMDRLPNLPRVIVLRLRNMTVIDSTGLQAIEELADVAQRSGRHVLLCGARPQPAQLMRQAEFERHVGANNVCRNISEALARAAQLHDRTAS